MKLCGFDIGLDQPFFLIAGPCVVESEQLQMDTAGALKEIAAKLFLSEGTVRNYISKILDKLDLRDRTQLAIWAIQSGVTSEVINDDQADKQ